MGARQLLNFVKWFATIGFCALAILVVTALWPAAAANIGTTIVVVKSVTASMQTVSRQLVINDSVEQEELIATAPDAATEIQFVDGTKVTLGPNAKVVLDKFVYDPSPGKGALVLSVSEGVLRFTTGNMAHENYKIVTPTGTLGVRGTDLNILVDSGQTLVQVIDGSVSGSSTDGGVKVFDKGDCFSINGSAKQLGFINPCSANELTFINTQATVMNTMILAAINPTGGTSNFSPIFFDPSPPNVLPPPIVLSQPASPNH